MVRKKIIIYNLITLFMLYLNVVITFALIYMIMDVLNLGQIIDHYASPNTSTILNSLSRSIYFSAITLLAVGYGDITPFGICKAIAVLEAMIGYILPAAMVIGYAVFPSRSLLRSWAKRE